eukprot:m.13924 g.13924  ORF g.13924 m.13924 type:complete len:353 (+) comp25307_c0_seq3:94-1152(+)
MEIPNWIVFTLLIVFPVIYIFLIRSTLLEFLLLWNIAVGARGNRRKMSHSKRIHAYVCKTSLLDNVSICELFRLAKDLVASEDIGLEQFHLVLLKYKYVALFRDRLDGSLRGMLLIDTEMGLIKEGRAYNCIKMGLALFKTQYRGGPLAYFVAGYHLLKALLLHPFTPLYVLYKCFSHKSYMTSIRTCAEVYPRYDCETPAWEKSIMNDFGSSIAESEGVSYDSENCVIKREIARLQDHAAPATPDVSNNPHGHFFLEKNSGWSKGHCMIVLAKVTWGSLASLVYQGARRYFRGRKVNRRVPFRRTLSLKEVHSNKQFYTIDPIWCPSDNSLPQIARAPEDVDFSELDLPDI